ncbi:MAG: FecR family protein [Lachnospiraceae bacterium]|nr:FecR family protein [Lachnospiraceae bacterium]
MEERNSKKPSKRTIIICIAAVVVACVCVVLLFSNKAIRATTMRMLRMEGTVSLEENGKVKTVREDLRLKNGNAVNTEAASLCSIGLDDTKIVTMNEVSRAEFSQKGKALELNLTKGSLYFEVSKKLASDESFEIQTSTMVVGIRGTFGYVSCDEDGHEYVLTTDGNVHVIGTNPQTGEVKEIDVPAGSKIVVYLYNDRTVDSIMFALEPVTEDEIPEFVIARLQENEELLDKVVNDTGWSKPVILGEEESDEDANVEDEEPPTSSFDEENAEVTEESEETLSEPEPEPEPEPELEPQGTLPAGVVRNADGTFTLADGTVFDPDFYRSQYSDLTGMTDEELLNHYLTYGNEEERSANQAEQDQKDAEEAAKQAQQNAHDDDDDDDSSSSSNQQNGDPGQNTGGNNSEGYSFSNGTISRANDQGGTDPVGTLSNGVFTVTAGSHDMPLLLNGNTINISNIILSNDAEPGTEINKGSTRIVKGDAAWSVSYYDEATGQMESFLGDLGPNVPWQNGTANINGTSYSGLVISYAMVGKLCVIEDDGTVHVGDMG